MFQTLGKSFGFIGSLSPGRYPEEAVRRAGTFRINMPGECTFEQLFDAFTEAFPFDPPEEVHNADAWQALNANIPVESLGLDVGKELTLTGYVSWRLRLDIIDSDSALEMTGPMIEHQEFDGDLMEEIVDEEIHGHDETSPGIERPVYRILYRVNFKNSRIGREVDVEKHWRHTGVPTLGILAAAALDGADDLLAMRDAVLIVSLPDRPGIGGVFLGTKRKKWEMTTLDQLALQPGTLMRKGAWSLDGLIIEVISHNEEVSGKASFIVMSNGEFWKSRAIYENS